jgi:glycine cleavage system H protein
MDGFTYHDIFETKGIEYIIIIVFLLILIPFWMIVNKQVNVKERIRNALGILTARILQIPQGLFYSKNHTWVYLEKSGEAKIGVDDFLIKVAGTLNPVTLRSPGEKINRGEFLAEVEQNGKKLKIYAPLSGEIVTTNRSLFVSPEDLSTDPYEKGWLYSISPSNWKAETSNCFMGKEAGNWITGEVDRFKDFLAVSLSRHSSEADALAFQEGGEIRINPLSELPSEIWQDFQKDFLDAD